MSKIDLSDIREGFYKCRDFEISNLWQRSIFLSAFLLLCFSGYGIIIKYILENSENIIMHELASFLSIVGMVFSILWVMMGKASKAWYEFYEHQICTIEKETDLGIKEDYQMGNGIYNSDTCTIDSNIFTRNAGNYSPSKINIFIGHICMIIWMLTFIIHMCIIGYKMFPNLCSIDKIHPFIFSFLTILFIVVIFTAIKNKWAKSGFLSEFL